VDGHLTITKEQITEGTFLLIDKPLDWTSFDVVAKVRGCLRSQFGKLKVGHAGTLDPKATGLLVLAISKFTKKIDTVQALEKQYTGQIHLGKSTTTYDVEGEIVEDKSIADITPEMIFETAKSFIGFNKQIPPMFSARKVKGKALYKYAREGKIIERQPKTVEVKRFDVDSIELPYLTFTIDCSKGTYIRSIAHDMGERLNNAAHLSALRRTAIGEHKVENAWQIPDLEAAIKSLGDENL